MKSMLYMLFYNGRLAYNGTPLLTMEISHRCGIIECEKRMSDSVNKASKVIESFTVPVTLNLIPLLTMMSLEHIQRVYQDRFYFELKR